MAEIEVKTERELYEDWKPLLEGHQDAEHAERGFDERLEAEKGWIEQTNNSRGVDAEGHFPVERHVHSPRVQEFIDAVEGDHGDD